VVVELRVTEGCALVISPGKDDFLKGIGSVFESFAEACGDLERMLENEELVSGVVEATDVEVQTPMKDLILDEEYEAHRTEAEELIERSYAHVLLYMERYDPIRCACYLVSSQLYLDLICTDFRIC
jgi:hypothetical protein